MLHTLILPLFGLLGIYYTFCTLTLFTSNKVLLIILTILTILVQIAFVDIIIPYPINFNTQYLITQYLFPLWNKIFHN